MTGRPIIRIKSTGYFEKLHYRLRKRLPMWTVYRPVTAEYPGLWVARMFVTLPESKPTRFTIASETLQELRATLPRGLFWVPRNPADKPEIEETWL
jgi:hypothetical protein